VDLENMGVAVEILSVDALELEITLGEFHAEVYTSIVGCTHQGAGTLQCCMKSVTVMAQVDEASLAPAFSSTSWQYTTVIIFHWSDFVVTFRTHLNSLVDGTN